MARENSGRLVRPFPAVEDRRVVKIDKWSNCGQNRQVVKIVKIDKWSKIDMWSKSTSGQVSSCSLLV
jgi:hypothetical protein